MAYTLPWLVVWGALLLVTQGAAAITGRLPWVVYSLAIFTMTLNLGMNGRVIARYRALRMGGVVAAALVAPFLVGLLALQPAGAQPARAASLGFSCGVDEIPELLRGLLPPEGALVEPNPGQVGQAMKIGGFNNRPGRENVTMYYLAGRAGTGVTGSITDAVSVSVYRDPGQAGATYGELTAGGLEGYVQEDVSSPAGPAIRGRDREPVPGGYMEYRYFGLAGAAVVEVYTTFTAPDAAARLVNNGDALFASLMAAAGALDPGAVFALEATGSCSGGAAATRTNGPGTSGGTGTSGTGVSGIGDLLNGAPIKPGDLTQGLLLANGLLLLVSLGQFVASSGGWTGGATSGPGGTPANGTPFGDGRVWYRAPWDVGGPVPMSPADVAAIENMQRQGYIWSGTDGWVTPEQSAANEAMRAHQLAVERAESAQAAAESHRAIQAARDAQAAARQEIRNINRRAVIDIEMREAERQHDEDMADFASAERVARVGEAVEAAGDLAATGLGIVGGPLGITVRAGYRVLKGTAGGLGTGIADGASYGETTKRMYIGTVGGAVTAGVEIAVDAGVRKVFGLPPLFPAAQPPVPPSQSRPRRPAPAS